MTSRITAEAVIRGIDQTGPAFKSVEAKINSLKAKFGQVGKAAAISAQVDKLNAALRKTQDQLAGVQRLRTAEEKLARLSTRHAQQKAIAEEQANARTAAAAQRAAAAYHRQETAVSTLKRELQGAGVAVNRLATEEARLRGAVDSTSGAIARQNRVLAQAAMHEERRASRRHALGMIAGGAGVFAAHEAARFGRSSFETYREFDLERRTGKAVMGLTDAEQEPLVRQAIHGGATSKFNDIKWLQTQRELAERGLTKEQVLGLTPIAAILAQALGTTEHPVDMPEAARSIEASLFGFKRHFGTVEEAKRAAQRTADLQVTAAKASGMTPEDLQQLYKFGATPARLAGVSEESLLAFGGIAKRSNIPGDEAGTAFRALMKNLVSPTRQAREAMLANGLNFKNYQRAPQQMDVGAFAENVAAQYGVRLNGKAKSGLARIFSNQTLLDDPAKFTPAVVEMLRATLGGRDAKSLKSISGMANRYRNASVENIDVNRMIADLIPKLANLQFDNALFGSKQGGRISAAMSDAEARDRILGILFGHSEGRAQDISNEKMAGVSGAADRFEGAVKNLETSFMRAWDAGGAGGPLTALVDSAGKLVQGFAELDGTTMKVASGFGALAALYAGGHGLKLLMGGFGLKASALALDTSAAALTEAAAVLAGKGAIGDVAGKAAGAAGSGAAAGGATRRLLSGALRYGGPAAAAVATMWPTEVGNGEATGEQKAYWDNQVQMLARIQSAGPIPLSTGGRAARSFLLTPPAEPAPAPPENVYSIVRDRALEDAGYGTGLGPARGSIDSGLGGKIEAALADLKGSLADTLGKPLDVTGKLDPVELKGEASVRVTVAVDGAGKVVNQFASSSGHLRASVGTSMKSLAPGSPPPDT